MIKTFLIASLRFIPLLLLCLFAFILTKYLWSDFLRRYKSSQSKQFFLFSQEPSGGADSYQLVVRSIPNKQHKAGIIFILGENTTIGRNEDNDIFVEDRYVSGRHALISLRGDEFLIKDLDSANGVYLNGQKIKKTAFLQPGDVIGVGETLLEVERG